MTDPGHLVLMRNRFARNRPLVLGRQVGLELRIVFERLETIIGGHARWRRERGLEDVIDLVDELDGKLFPDLVRNFAQVFFVVDGHDDVDDARAVRSKELFLDATDGKHLTSKRNLAGHGHI